MTNKVIKFPKAYARNPRPKIKRIKPEEKFNFMPLVYFIEGVVIGSSFTLMVMTLIGIK